MKRFLLLLACLGMFVLEGASSADSIWERRTPYYSGMLFEDYRARHIGDVLTIVVNESTIFDGKEDRKMKKETKANNFLSLVMKFTGGASSRSFNGDMTGSSTSQRQFDGKSDYKSDRTFTDRMTVVVVDVMPNGNLVIEGYRKRLVAREERMLRVTGIVRPADISPFNVVQSQYVGNFQIAYTGKGAESSYINNGWFGRVMNAIWPY